MMSGLYNSVWPFPITLIDVLQNKTTYLEKGCLIAFLFVDINLMW